ncbi:MAG: MmcQ/YjbR family DNA-binding protein [Deltaproteobacteria bacterium]|nr:MmcQ/YjbR family DNA-binding protein [Deltaproteobacteria bacterium]MBI3388110.1 MmcQ/YjbR family DNA-binding protein [Deltaproteobacteria bacterium]
MTDDPLPRLRRICLALPESTEKEAWGDPTFRVRDKIFAMMKYGDGRISMWCKAPPGVQSILVGADPKRFFVPPYVGHKGWIGVRLDITIDWDEVATHAQESYRMTAPRRRRARLDHTQPTTRTGADSARTQTKGKIR